MSVRNDVINIETLLDHLVDIIIYSLAVIGNQIPLYRNELYY